MPASSPRTDAPAGVTFREALRVWAYVGLNSFGGPAGQIAVMHRVLVEEKRWIGERRFLHALNYCMLLPGPEATQLAVYVGWLMHRTIGGLAAGILFVLPGALVMLVLSASYAAFGEIAWVAALFYGIKAAVLAVVVEAVVRIGRRALKNRVMVLLALAAFVAIFFFGVPFPAIVLAAGLFGWAGARVRPELFAPAAREASGLEDRGSVLGEETPDHARPTLARALRVLATSLVLWFAPLALAAAAFGRESVFVDLGLFFSRAAVVTFGGAYAVLAYVAEQAVVVHGWIGPGGMLDGLGLAETTPGPLILVLEFVGFQGAHARPEGLAPLAAGALGAALTVWVTFVPCFLWIFLGAPWIEVLRGNRSLNGALSAITAAVVGVILNLAVWFALHVLFAEVGQRSFGLLRLWTPRWETLDVRALVISVLASVAVFRFRAGMITTLAAAALLGVALHWPF
jgi:chromate transporter